MLVLFIAACVRSPGPPAQADSAVDTGAHSISDTSSGVDTLPELDSSESAAPTDSAHDSDDTSPTPATRCARTAQRIACTYETWNVQAGGHARVVHHQHPTGAPPPGGWPTLILFQGSLVSGELAWEATPNMPFGGWHQARMVADLLDAGYAVITPIARGNGGTWWDTNVPPWESNWTGSPDHALMVALFAGIEAGDLGPLREDDLYAAGISSGGYMTSRMAVAYPGRFRALAISSASYATCGGLVCNVPALPDDHPPTLFLHGERDAVVPARTMRLYDDALRAQGTPTRVTTDPTAGHEWIEATPTAVLGWLRSYP